jgi:hypothetical protein
MKLARSLRASEAIQFVQAGERRIASPLRFPQ